MSLFSFVKRFLPVIGCISILTGCNSGGPPESCTNILILAEDETVKEYSQFIPRYQDFVYLYSDVSFTSEGTEYLFRINKHIVMNRDKSMYDDLTVISYKDYVNYCAASRSDSDTLRLLIDNGEKYSEFNIVEWGKIETDNGVSTSYRGDSISFLGDFSKSTGFNGTAGPDEIPFKIKRIDEIDCYRIYHTERVHEGDTITESFIPQLGSIHRIDATGEYKLSQVNGEELRFALKALCE